MEYVVQAFKVLKNLVHTEAKGHLLLLQNGLWELACKFHVLINAKIQTCIKLIGNRAKKSCLDQESDKKSSFLSSRVCLSVYQVFQNFESLYNILHILT